MNEGLKILLLSYPSGLLFFFIINIIYFTFSKQSESDQIFDYKLLDYKYEDVKVRLEKLQAFLGFEIGYAFKKLEKYHENAQRTRNKFLHHQETIERSIVLIYAKKDKETPVKYLYKNLSILLKIEVFFSMLFFPSLLVIAMFLIPIELIFFKIILLIFWIIIVYSFWFLITKFIMTIKYEILDSIFRLFNIPTGKLRRNINSLDYLYHTSYFHRPLKWLILGGVLSLFGGKGMKGFGGGSFGGGGAGGGW
jgi:hypothetical protein